MIGVGLDEVHVHQRVEQLGGLGRAGVQQRREHPTGKGPDRQQSQCGEGFPYPLGQSAQAQLDTRPDGQIAGRQHVQPAVLVSQRVRQPLQCPMWTGGQPGAGDPDG